MLTNKFFGDAHAENQRNGPPPPSSHPQQKETRQIKKFSNIILNTQKSSYKSSKSSQQHLEVTQGEKNDQKTKKVSEQKCLWNN